VPQGYQSPIFSAPRHFRALASGQLPSTKGTLYTSPGETELSQITLVEVDGTSRTVNIYLKLATGSSRRLIPANLTMDPTSGTGAAQVECLEAPLGLGPGDSIEGDASAASAVDYVITGATR
jgi:hypothetical protein